MIRSIIVEDSIHHSQLLEELLGKLPYSVEVLAVCRTIESAIEAIGVHRPDLVFLDISLHGNKRGGFDFLERIDSINFDVIFTTAFIDENILDIRMCGLSYIVKPYTLPEVEDAVKKYSEKGAEYNSRRQIRALKTNLLEKEVQHKVLFLKVNAELFQIEVKNLLYCYSTDPIVTYVFTTENRELIKRATQNNQPESNPDPQKKNVAKPNPRIHIPLEKITLLKECYACDVRKTMREVEADLHGLNFYLFHKSFLVNIMHVNKFIRRKSEPSKIVVSNGETIRVSDSGKNLFFRLTGRV